MKEPLSLHDRAPVQFEITEQTRTALEAWMRQARLRSEDFQFPTRLRSNSCLVMKLESTVRYLGIEVDDALEMAEQTEV